MPNALLTKLGIQLPIIQAPMAGTSTVALAAAVSNAGGLGSLGLANYNVAQAREQIQQLKQATCKPFNVQPAASATQPWQSKLYWQPGDARHAACRASRRGELSFWFTQH